MLTTLVRVVATLAVPVVVATVVLVVEIVAALLPARRGRGVSGGRPRCAVLIPAHNEETGIGVTIAAILPQLSEGDRVLVVADNCSDATAAVARSAGAEVVERSDSDRRGKGYALDFGVRVLASGDNGGDGALCGQAGRLPHYCLPAAGQRTESPAPGEPKHSGAGDGALCGQAGRLPHYCLPAMGQRTESSAPCEPEHSGAGVPPARKAPLTADSPQVVVIVDADCIMEAGSLDRLVRTAAATGRPVQAAYRMQPPPGGGTKSQLSAFLFALKNVVRPRGLARLGVPCLLTGTGMAFPWDLLRNAPLASGNIVEDMQLGIDLALAGRAPLFCPDASVTSELPAAREAAASQRTRWVHGHLRTLATQTPRLLAAAVCRGRINLLGLALELSVPPLSLLVLLGMFATLALTAGWLLGGPALPALAITAAGGAAALALFAAWLRFGREFLPAAGLLAVPCELLNRLPILFRYLLRPQDSWVRTARRTAD